MIRTWSSFRWLCRACINEAVPAVRRFRCKASLEAIQAAETLYYEQREQQQQSIVRVDGDDGSEGGSPSGEGTISLVLYNYPSISGAYAALFAHLYHTHLHLPFLVLPFSSVHPFSVDDLRMDCVACCYLLDFVGPTDFLLQLSRCLPRVIAFDHRRSTAARISRFKCLPPNLSIHIDVDKSCACAVYDYFSRRTLSHQSLGCRQGLLDSEDEIRVTSLLQYINDADIRRFHLPDSKAFHTGLREERLNLNTITNPVILDQLLTLDAADIVRKGNSHSASQQNAAKKLIQSKKLFKMRLGRGLHGECLGLRADKDTSLSHVIGDELSKMSASDGLRPIGAVVFMQRGLLKVCLRSTDCNTDTSEIAKAYGGGGKSGSSSFVLQMAEYNQWIN